jgi:hypothetical protein
MASLTEMAAKAVGKRTPGDEEKEPTKKLVPPKIPPKEVVKRLDRGRERLKQVQARRKQAIEFVNGNHYVFITEDRLQVNQTPTVAISDGGLMPDHRVRRSHDLLGPIIKRKISTAVQRIPGYEVIQSDETEQAFLAAQIAEKVLYAGYDKWEVKRAMKKLIWNALVTEEGFIGSRWDSSVGPYVDVSRHPEGEHALVEDENGKQILNPYYGQPHPDEPHYVGMGEIELVVLGGLEVLSEPGIEFEKSRWIGIETAKPVSMVEEEPDFIDNGEKLKADAESAQVAKPNPKIRSGTELVMVTEYLERPCAKWPEGRRLVIANNREIFPEERYPVEDAKGKVVDEPALHRLSYAIDAASDKNRGLVQSLVEPMRSYDMSMNKGEEWIQLAQVPQVMAPEGSIITPLTDEPGLVIETDPNVVAGSNVKPEWKPTQNAPDDIEQKRRISQEELSRISFDTEVPASVESGKQVQAIYELNQVAWQDFIIDLADVHALVARDNLTLVQRRYSEQRLKNFKGAAGWEDLAEFRGADIKGQTDVRVDPGSLEPRTRAAIEGRISQMNLMFPGYFPPPLVLTALNQANPDKLSEPFERQEARTYHLIAQIKNGTFWKIPPRPLMPDEEAPLPDPVTGEPVIDYRTGEPFQMTSVPGWLPKPFENADIIKAVLENWFLTSDWDELDPERQSAGLLVYKAVLDIQSKAAQRRAELQTNMAEQAGAANAAQAGQPKVMPSMPQPSSPGNQPEPAAA